MCDGPVTECRFRIQILWFDEDVVELRIAASNRDFSGSATFYESHDFAKRLCASIVSFPRAADDVREANLGDLHGRSGMGLRLFCLDGSGHACVEVALSNDGEDYAGLPAEVKLSLWVEAGGIDRFAADLEAMPFEIGSTVVLNAAA